MVVWMGCWKAGLWADPSVEHWVDLSEYLWADLMVALMVEK